MANKARSHIADLRGASRLAVDGTRAVTAVVEAMHATIASGPAILGSPLAAPARLATRLVYGHVRLVTRLIGLGVDLALAQLAPFFGASVPGVEREAALAILNGVLGDYLVDHHNPLAIEMRLRRGGEPVDLAPQALRAAFPDASGRLVVLIHGSCANDLQWTRGGHDHGASLARDLGYTPVYLHYNSGLHISTTGRAFATLLEELVAAWPAPVDELVLVGHSMGGLVARSACHAGDEMLHAWRPTLRALITLGAPHHGAPLERGGNWLEHLLGISRYSAPLGRLGRIRSAGITDLRFGNVVGEDWQGRDRFALGEDPRQRVALPAGVHCYAIAGTLATDAGDLSASDGIVPVASALGAHADRARDLAFPDAHRWIAAGTGHIDLLGSPDVYATLRSWLTPRQAREP